MQQHSLPALLLILHLSLFTSLTHSTPFPPPTSHLPDFFTPLPTTNFTPPVCRFASPTHLPNPAALLTNTTLRTSFIHSLLYWEAQFLQHSPCLTSCCHFTAPSLAGGVESYIGLHTPTMVTMDGHRLSIPSGLPLDGGAHMFTASSKESLHVALLALALSSTPAAALAAMLLAPGSGGRREAAMDVAVRQLAVKVNSYDLFDCRFPGFGGFLPWVAVEDDGISPQPGWETTVPALDNGQLIWAVYALLEVLESDEQLRTLKHIPLNSSYCPYPAALLSSPNTTLAERWRAVLSRWQTNALTVFYDYKGRFRDVAFIRNTTTTHVTAANYYTDPDCNDGCYLDDPYEGELFTVYAYLYANWTGWDDRQWLWLRKRAKLQAATLAVPGYGNITTQRGFWFSAHEQWKYLFLPYRDVAINDRVFTLGEKARLLWSQSQKVPGLYASINGLAADDAAEMEYHSDCGIRQLAMVDVDTDFEVTPYGAMNAMLLMHPPSQYVSSSNKRHRVVEAEAETMRTKVLLNVDEVRQEALAAIANAFSVSPTLQSSTLEPLEPSELEPTPTTATPNYIGLAWLASSISHPRGQTCFGVTEGVSTNGTLVSPLHTWDSSITTVLGVLGGTVPLGRQRMVREGVYGQFVGVVESEWSRVFDGVLEGDEVEWMLPSMVVPSVVEEWSSCTETSNVCLCGGEKQAQESRAAGGWKGNAKARKRPL